MASLASRATSLFLLVFLVELDVEKALHEQLFFEAFRTERSGPRPPPSAAGQSELAGTVALGIVIVA